MEGRIEAVGDAVSRLGAKLYSEAVSYVRVHKSCVVLSCSEASDIQEAFPTCRSVAISYLNYDEIRLIAAFARPPYNSRG